MSRRAGQISPREALLGGLAIALLLTVVVAGSEALLRPSQQPAVLDVTPAPSPLPCPPAREVLPPGSVPAPPRGATIAVSSAQLIECPTVYDGRTVLYTGEVVRAVLARGERAWVQLNDDPYALDIGPLPAHRVPAGLNSGMAVSIPSAAAERITTVGDARARGDRLRVEGTFLRTDPADAGGPTIQAHRVDVIAPGEPLRQRFSVERLVVAITLATAALAMAAAARSRSR